MDSHWKKRSGAMLFVREKRKGKRIENSTSLQPLIVYRASYDITQDPLLKVHRHDHLIS